MNEFKVGDKVKVIARKKALTKVCIPIDTNHSGTFTIQDILTEDDGHKSYKLKNGYYYRKSHLKKEN